MRDAQRVSGLSEERILSVLLRLVAVDAARTATGRRVSYSSFIADEQHALQAFIDHRLIYSTSDDPVSVGVAHEAFLSAWQPLATFIEKQASALMSRTEVEHAAAQWRNAGRPRRALWDGGQLAANLSNLGTSVPHSAGGPHHPRLC